MKNIRKLLAVILAVCLISVFGVMTMAEDTDKLSFREDGTFKIMQLADIQDDQNLDSLCEMLIRGAIEKEMPDVIVLTGDNIAGYRTGNAANTKKAIANVMDILDEYGIPVIVTYGNHDIYQSGLNRDQQLEFYLGYDCVKAVFNNGPEAGNSCVPVYSSKDDTNVQFLIWALDTGANEGEDGSRVDNGGVGYDHIREAQVNWFKETSAAYNAADTDSDVINSIIFQHIEIPELFDALVEAKFNDDGALPKYGKYWVLPDNAKEGSVMKESPCPSANNGGEFEMAKADGGVLAIVSGHDHDNSFIIPYEGIDIINSPTCGFQSYGSNQIKGIRMFVINEEDTTSYDTYIVQFPEVVKMDSITEFRYKVSTVIQNFYSFFNNLWQRIVSIFNLSDRVL